MIVTKLKYHSILGCVGLIMLALSACTPRHGGRGAYLDIVRPDRRPPLVGARTEADSLWGPSSESLNGDGIAESRRSELEQLVRRFAPTLVLPKADHTIVDGKRYQLVPTNAHLFTDTLRLDIFRASPYSFNQPVDIPLKDLSADSLASLTDSILRYESNPDILVATFRF